MPSGFQQDSNQLQPANFRVIIDMTNFYDDDTIYGGRVNPYAWDNFTGSDLPQTVENAEKLARGNLRFQRIIEEVTKYNDGQIIDVECNANGDDITGNNVPTALAFTVRYDRFGIEDNSNGGNNLLETAEQQYLRQYWNDTTMTDSEYDGEGINHDYEAIQNMIMRALIGVRISNSNSSVKTHTRSVRVFQPVVDSDPFVGEGIQQKITIGDVTNDGDSLSWNNGDLRTAITVQLMDGTTVINESGDNDAQTTT